MQFFTSLKDRTKLIRKRSLHRIKMWINYCWDRRPKDPIFVVAARRSGSNLLLDYLQSMPGVSFQSELLNPRMLYGLRRRGISKRSVLRHIAHSIHYGEHRVCGAKLMADQMRGHGLFLDDLKGFLPTARFIIIYRRSLIDQYISLKIAEKTDVWRWVDGEFTPPGQIDFNIREFREFSAFVKSFYAEVLASPWVRERSIVMSYEDLTADAQGTFDRQVFPFTGLPPVKVRSVTKKQNCRQPGELIPRYQEVLASLKEEWQWQDYPAPAVGAEVAG